MKESTCVWFWAVFFFTIFSEEKCSKTCIVINHFLRIYQVPGIVLSVQFSEQSYEEVTIVANYRGDL